MDPEYRKQGPSKEVRDGAYWQLQNTSVRDDPRSGKKQVTTEIRRMFRPMGSGLRSSPLRRPQRRRTQKRAISAAQASKMKPSGKLSGQKLGNEEAKVADDAMHAQEGASKMIGDVLDKIFEKNKRLTGDFEMYRQKETEYEEINSALKELLDEILVLCQHYAVECDIDGGKWSKSADLDSIPDFLVKLVEGICAQNENIGTSYIELVKKVEDYEKQVADKGIEIRQATEKLERDIEKLKPLVAKEEKKVAMCVAEVDKLKGKLADLRDDRLGDAKRRTRDVGDIQLEIESLKARLKEAKENAAKARADAEMTVADLKKQIAEKTARILELEGRRGDIRGKIDDIKEQLQAALKELEKLKAERLLIIDVIQSACTSAFYDRLTSDIELDPNRPINVFLEKLLENLIGDLQKAWSLAGRLEIENQSLLKKRKDDTDDDAVKVKLDKKFGQPAKDLKGDTQKVLLLIENLKKELDDTRRANDLLRRKGSKDAEKLQSMLTDCSIKYDSDKVEWDKLGDEFKVRAAGLMKEMGDYQNQIEVIRAEAANRASLLQQKEEEVLRLQLQIDSTKMDLMDKLVRLEKEAATLKGQVKQGKGIDDERIKLLKQKTERAFKELELLRGDTAGREKQLSDSKVLAAALEKDISIEQNKRKETVKDRDELRQKSDEIWRNYEDVSKELASKKIQLEKEVSLNNGLTKKIKQLEVVPEHGSKDSKKEKEARIGTLEQQRLAANQQTVALSRKIDDIHIELDDAKKVEVECASILRAKTAENVQLSRDVAAARNQLTGALTEKAHLTVETNRLRADKDRLQREFSRCQADNIRNKERLIELHSAVYAAHTLHTSATKNVCIRRYQAAPGAQMGNSEGRSPGGQDPESSPGRHESGGISDGATRSGRSASKIRCPGSMKA